MKSLTKREAMLWAVGLFEGEGSFIWGRVNGVTLSIHLTDEDVLRKFHSIVGVGHFREPYQRTDGPVKDREYKPIFHWNCSVAEDTLAFITAMDSAVRWKTKITSKGSFTKIRQNHKMENTPNV